MRIQHNIMAMNAYRNYNNNTSALSKNLEKLSSGYKINRAGDDAAGLAISEKMRAQITGLNAAQKNVKDGISLVKTAEGAMQEIQDMLNRMDYLATQSANGTYQDEVDREALQKEVDQLITEINRIADSANFNGIKLLDGSLDLKNSPKADAIKAAQAQLDAANKALQDAPNAKGDPTVWSADDIKGKLLQTDQAPGDKPLDVAGTKAIYETEGTTAGTPEFSIELDGLAEQVANVGKELNLTVNSGTGAQTITKADGSAITIPADKVQGTKMTDKELAALFDGAKVTVDGVDYTASVDADSTRIKFTADAESLTAVNPKLDVAFTPTTTPDAGVTAGSVNNGKVAKYEFDLTNVVAGDVKTDTKIDGVAVAFNNNASDTADDFVAAYNADATKAYTASNNAGKITLTAKNAGLVTTDPTSNLVIAADGNEAITATETQAGEAAGKTAGTKAVYTVDLTGGVKAGLEDAGATIDGVAITWNTTSNDLAGTLNDFVATYNATAGKDYVATTDGSTVTLTARATGAVNTAPAVTNMGDIVTDGSVAAITDMTEAAEGTDSKNVKADGTTSSINVGTVDIKFTDADAAGQLANNVLDLTTVLDKDGAEIKLGDTTYVLALGSNSANANATDTADTKYVKVSDANMADIGKVASALTQAAADNKTFTVGQGSTAGKITLQQLASVKDTTDMRNADEFASYIGVSVPSANNTQAIQDATDAANAAITKAEAALEAANAMEDKDGKALNLQIGDTSDDFNQMKVSIGDMHADAMVYKVVDKDGNETGETMDIETLNIKTSENAQKAVNVIKNAINYVSSVRGDLGAYQNRLEHTANNLSVMAENIQDAESTIRDTDVAEEMMSYVKNNILVQSAQAMLAQANQVPQGVLQLLG